MSYSGLKDEELINQWLDNISEDEDYIEFDSDLTQSDNQSLRAHNEAYSDLLDLYVENYRESSKDKRVIRKCLCWVSIAILVVVTIVVAVVSIIAVLKGIKNSIDFIGVVTPLVVALASFVSAFMTIPNVIANYLFDKDEENHLSTIINNIQDYDSKIRDKRK